MAFTGCSKDSTNPEIEKPGTVTMTVIASDKIENAPLTRTHYDEITQKIQWDGDGSTEFIQFLEQDNAAATPALQAAESTSCTLTAGKASFTVTLKENPSTDLTYAAVYPAGNYVTDNQSLSKVKVNLPATQTPLATSFDPNADLMVARAVQMTSQPKTEPISLSFGRVAALGKMTITNLGLAADETVKSVSFTAAGKVLAGRSYVDIATGRIIEIGYFSPSDRIIMDFSAAGTIAPASFPAWFTCYPCSLAANDSFTLVVTSSANKTYTKQVTLSGAQKLVFTPGDITTVSVNMAGIAGETQASDAKIATLTYEEISGLTWNYGVPVDYTNTGGTWTVEGYKNKGIQLNVANNERNPRIVLPHFTSPISSVSVTIASGTANKIVYLHDEKGDQIASMPNDVATNSFTLTSYPEPFYSATITANGTTVITSVTVTTGATIRIADIKDVAATGVTGASATYEPVSFTGEDDTAVTAFDGTIVTAASIDNTTKTLTYTVSPNYTGDAREGSITLTSANNDATVTIKVSQKADQFEVSPASITLGGDSGATAEFTLTSDFEVDAPVVSAPDKFSVSDPVDNVNKVYTVTALADGGAAEAELGTITFTRKGDSKPISVKVSQAAKGSSVAKYKKITVLSELTEGSYYLSTPTYKLYNGTISKGHLQTTSTSATATATEITSIPNDAVAVTFTSTGGTNQYNLLDANGKYINVSKASSGGFKLDATQSTSWTFSEGSSGWISVGNNFAAYIRSYSGSSFRSYATTGNGDDIFLIKIEN